MTPDEVKLGVICNVVQASLSYIGLKLDSSEPIALDSSDVDELQRLLKVALYLQGKYSMPVPPVITSGWSMHDWINFIDSNGTWGWTCNFVRQVTSQQM